jgi:hypothetical protein
MKGKRGILRHFLASIVYHANKAIRDAPDNYPDLKIGMGVKTPRQILHHITGVLTYAHSFFEKYETTYSETDTWEKEILRFHEIIATLDNSLKQKLPVNISEEQLLQGPLSDSMAHIGQLLMLRRLSGSPIAPENFLHADIKVVKLGKEH